MNLSFEPRLALMGLIVQVAILVLPPVVLPLLDDEPNACFATEESYDPLYTFELFL
jgi:hypothetical protein